MNFYVKISKLSKSQNNNSKKRKMGKFFRQLIRPFQYVAKTGSQQTRQINRYDVGGKIQKSYSVEIKRNVSTIVPNAIRIYLQEQGLYQPAIKFFQPLQWVKIGASQTKCFELNRTNASVEYIGVAVKKLSEISMKIGLIWKKSVVEFQAPSTVINYVTSHYGLGWRNSNSHSTTIARGLNQAQNQNIINRVKAESQKFNLAIEAQQSI